MLEKQIEQHLVKEVKKAGGWAVKLYANSIAGLPDRIILMPKGKTVFIELKAPGKKPRKIQNYIHSILKSLGFEVLIIDTKEKVNDFITLRFA